MRIAIAGFMQETNSFVPFTTTVQTFEEQYYHRGDELLTAFGSARLEIPGALDVTVQAQVLKLLDDVRRQMNLAMLFITHDMRVAAQVCHRVMVMRHGKVVECGPTRDIFAAPSNDYTKALLAAIPGRQAI